MTLQQPNFNFVDNNETIQTEGRRILRRLAEPGVILAFAPEMEKAVVLRTGTEGSSQRLAVVDRALAQAFALKDWIRCKKPGRVASYDITPAGRAALRQLLAEEAGAGLAEAPAHFSHARASDAEDDSARRIRYCMVETAVAVLGRRRDKDGKAFLDPAMIAAAEQLREDFELAQIAPAAARNWQDCVTAHRPATAARPATPGDRVAQALADLGPGLGDVALRVCCYQDGIETAEQRLGWAARSGKVVLRIALQRLARHYAETYGKSGPLIG